MEFKQEPYKDQLLKEAQQYRAQLEAKGWLEEQYLARQEKLYNTVKELAQKEALRKHFADAHQQAVKPKEKYSEAFRKEVGTSE